MQPQWMVSWCTFVRQKKILSWSNLFFLMNFPILKLLVTITRTGLHVQKKKPPTNQQWQLINPAEYFLPRKGWKHVQYIDLNQNMSFFPDRPSEVLRHQQKPLGSMWPLWSGWIWGTGPNHHLTLATIIIATKSKGGVLQSRTVPELCVLHSPYPCSMNGDTTFIASKLKSNKTQCPQHKLWLGYFEAYWLKIVRAHNFILIFSLTLSTVLICTDLSQILNLAHLLKCVSKPWEHKRVKWTKGKGHQGNVPSLPQRSHCLAPEIDL